MGWNYLKKKIINDKLLQVLIWTYHLNCIFFFLEMTQ